MFPGAHGKLSVPESWTMGKEPEWGHKPLGGVTVVVVRRYGGRGSG